MNLMCAFEVSYFKISLALHALTTHGVYDSGVATDRLFFFLMLSAKKQQAASICWAGRGRAVSRLTLKVHWYKYITHILNSTFGYILKMLFTLK